MLNAFLFNALVYLKTANHYYLLDETETYISLKVSWCFSLQKVSTCTDKRVINIWFIRLIQNHSNMSSVQLFSECLHNMIAFQYNTLELGLLFIYTPEWPNILTSHRPFGYMAISFFFRFKVEDNVLAIKFCFLVSLSEAVD